MNEFYPEIFGFKDLMNVLYFYDKYIKLINRLFGK